ncbi:TonB-dependent receptor [Prosthecochloris sp.]|uniref:TonB-dependent receptor n=1 Tax=Prosthecochloris sp. TaxID=290513 RepID=UPI0025DADD45|nr:TonB-dependent receptor [Prosthecochloris sp.]
MKPKPYTIIRICAVAFAFNALRTLPAIAETTLFQSAEVVVTANKLEEDIKDVPQSITVIDETLIEEKGMKGVGDIITNTPGMNLETYGSPARVQVNIRGLNTSVFTNNNPVVIYVDGLPYSNSNGFDISLVNIERIEVLRGPQGTLYGKDAIGGVINVVTKEPTNEWSGKAGAEYGSFNHREFKFNTNGALKNDVLYFGLNGQYRADDGWQTNSFPGNEKDADKLEDGRWSTYLLFKPTEEFSAKFTYSKDYIDAYGQNGYGIIGGSFSDFNADDAEDVITEFETREELKVNSQALQLAYDFGDFTVTSVTTRRYQELEGIYDGEGGNDPIAVDAYQFDNSESEAWTQELTLKSNISDGLRYVAGIYLDMSEFKRGPYGQDFPFLSVFGFAERGNSVSETDEETAAIFGQIIYPVTGRLDVTLGGRYQCIKKDIDLEFFEDYVLDNTIDGGKEWSEFLPRVALNYTLNDNWSTYFSYSKGYMPGGFNFYADEGDLDDNAFEPQISTNYEIGLKAQTGKMTLGAAFFYMDIKDIHVFKANESFQFFADNAEKAHSMGVELEAAYRLTDAFQLDASVGFVEAEYDDYDAGGGVKYDGERIQQTPEYTLNLGAAYYHPNGFYGRADVNMTGETAFFSSNEGFVRRDAYTTVDARIGYMQDRWEVYAYGKNLSDERYITGYRAGGPLAVASFNDPRTFGIGARYSF